MENTLCGPSNSLETFKNHISVDRTLQQDRIGDGRPPAEVSAIVAHSFVDEL